MNTLRVSLTTAFVLFFGGLLLAGLGLGLLDGVLSTLLVAAGVLLTVTAPAAALVGLSIDERQTATSDVN